jgi:hypothetical protein
MAVFLRPKEAPYFGSYHLVVFDFLHPKLFAKDGVKVKEVHESTWYQWVKNGDFALIYGAGKRKTDATFHVPGAHEMLKGRFPNIFALADKQARDAKRLGYVQTIPDRTIDPNRGFPVMAGRTDSGDILPTTPLNYHVSATACWAAQKAQWRCDAILQQWADSSVWQRMIPAHMKMQVHDEIVFDFPRSVSPADDLQNEKDNGGPLSELADYRSNLGYVRQLQREMEKSGDDIGMPLPVGVEYNADNWSEVTLKC